MRAAAQSLEAETSYTPFDSIRECVEALAAFLETGRASRAGFNCEPEQYDWRFCTGDAEHDAVFAAIHFRDHRRGLGLGTPVFNLSMNARQLGRRVWRALRRAQSELARQSWPHDFPVAAMVRLDELTRTVPPRRGTSIR
jgi:hypothetical protein